ncbi:EscU/YscU/HrcU family type III secretion system export apparatus switch protein [Thalassobaculum litoreum]|uniref:EscU/YscU/HrcU family type III secretion system export apparatus switch protein n=1 Tax=Thalassobaculum litoreum TaxID=420996 RepID=UPI0031831B41
MSDIFISRPLLSNLDGFASFGDVHRLAVSVANGQASTVPTVVRGPDARGREDRYTAPMTRRPNTPASPRGSAPERQIAIALSHDIDSGLAPTVVAKGYGEMAEKILDLAFRNDVKVRTDPDLAQILEVVEVDCEIPLEAFAAVAEILTYVYRANDRMKVENREGEPRDDR